jgi:hypothetical protein
MWLILFIHTVHCSSNMVRAGVRVRVRVRDYCYREVDRHEYIDSLKKKISSNPNVYPPSP